MKAMNTPTHMLLKSLVGAPGFEPGASCAQDRIPSSRKCLDFNHAIENSRRYFVACMCVDVRRCGCLIVGSLQKSLQFSSRNSEGTV
jgi:hypothetical protein